ncbi:origin recognition complex subunit 2 [Cylas formicarius]|uniref:origin recognition complex subunit 2 n=1 Tax=Cylas formicarius TaxID=197179 RepID=UPI002958A5AF|nr:origin recognition complex subunit 2 [Cylas formicarius]
MEENSNTPTPLRRTTRRPKPSLKALESITISKLQDVVIASPSSEEEISSGEEGGDVKPVLLHKRETLSGKAIFQFHTPKRRGNVIRKAVELSRMSESSSDIDFSSEASTSSDSSIKVKEKRTTKFSTVKKTKGYSNKVSTDYSIKTEEYFSNFASNKIQTSDNTLDKLKTPRLPHYELKKLLANKKLTKEHAAAMERMSRNNKKPFQKWLYLLQENFSLLLYGLGSKRDIVNTFRKEHLQKPPVLVVNGFFPPLTIKDILDGIIVDILELENPGNPYEACNLIEREFENTSYPLYLIINNIDGEPLRDRKTQNILARLAATSNVHLIATIDHINAPLIWDQETMSKFNYIWWDATSFSPYMEETSFEKSLMEQQSGALALSSLKKVFLSLTPNSKAIFLKLVKYQIENSGPYYEGMAFKDLYMSCREGFIISSYLALRAHLNEFLDHKMVKTKRSSNDGTEYLVIQLSNDILRKFLDDNAES